jgi:hypothetical protein
MYFAYGKIYHEPTIETGQVNGRELRRKKAALFNG